MPFSPPFGHRISLDNSEVTDPAGITLRTGLGSAQGIMQTVFNVVVVGGVSLLLACQETG